MDLVKLTVYNYNKVCQSASCVQSFECTLSKVIPCRYSIQMLNFTFDWLIGKTTVKAVECNCYAKMKMQISQECLTMLLVNISDPRFRSEFRQFYRWNDDARRYKLGWELNLEILPGSSYPARSRLECVTVCQSLNNCTGVDYVPGEGLCYALSYNHVVLP